MVGFGRKGTVNIMVYSVKKKYQWCDDFHKSVDPDVVGAVLEDIEHSDGEVTPAAFLDRSRAEDSPTHSLFEWNDSKAAEKYRIEQSRQVIKSLRVIYVDHSGEKVPVRAFVRASNNASVYENIYDALSDEVKKEIILKRLQDEVDSLILRNKHITELADILETAVQRLKAG